MISKSCAKDEGSVLRPGFVHTSGGLVYKHLPDKLSLHIRSMFTHLRLSSSKLLPPNCLQRRLLTFHRGPGPSISVPELSGKYHFSWLRDSCQCSTCIHPSTRQKLHRSTDFIGIEPESIESKDDGLYIEWATNKHRSFYDRDFLARYATVSSRHAFNFDVKAEPWTSSYFANNPSISYHALDAPEALLDVYKELLRSGLVFFHDVPTKETSDSTCELRQLATRLSEIRYTFYGETWDVRAISNSKNIAYTNLNLGLHMDLLYFKEPPRYQILHCLRNRVHGGNSVFVDALNAARKLNESAFKILATTPVPFHYINDGHHLHHAHTTIECVPSYGGQEIRSINYSPPFQAPLLMNTPDEFYDSLSELERHLEDPQNLYTRLLREGDAVIFDNRRVLHGRTAFESRDSEEGEIDRWLKGCYLEEDPILDRMRILRKTLGS